ncbi:MAG TPA: signal recognition particle-docking protein FtsY, partial [Myxococcota bacterium]|nr:signal recognition particle-docking protein FtsY [Myxococcota bacterium]
KEAAARAEEEKKRKAEEDKKKAEQDKKKAEQDKKKAPKKDEVVHKLEIPAKAAPARTEEGEEPARTLKDGLGRTRKEGFIAKLGSLFAGKQIDQDLMDEVEEALFTADPGVRTADRLLQAVKDALSKKELKDADKVWEVLRAEAQRILEGATGKPETQPKPGEPKVTMVLGVNGTGKTTSIGKLAHKLVGEGRKVTLVAGDTFRAAAAEQLEHWARRVDAVCIRGKEGADPASVVFDGVKQAVDNSAEFVLVDTAGRLHNNVNLMEELKKVRRVMGRAIESAPHEVLMVLDATTGQNGITQAKLFKDATDVTGIILTKLDGTAKGGVVLGVCDELKIPIRWIGVGERVSDLRPFDPKEFVDELFAPPV